MSPARVPQGASKRNMLNTRFPACVNGPRRSQTISVEPEPPNKSAMQSQLLRSLSEIPAEPTRHGRRTRSPTLHNAAVVRKDGLEKPLEFVARHAIALNRQLVLRVSFVVDVVK